MSNDVKSKLVYAISFWCDKFFTFFLHILDILDMEVIKPEPSRSLGFEVEVNRGLWSARRSQWLLPEGLSRDCSLVFFF
jgi:hypothetical protein